ncbi:hypothetical protein [Glycomyces sp. NPDC047010]|uniref:hypothetical protein n=1 Tax=Glycomyces sp. NPDC047010 TaxID=3155023 RepID=UPI0033E0BCA2
MTNAAPIRRTIDVFDLAGSDVTMFQREGDAFDMVRLAYIDEPDIELGRVVQLADSRAQLATGIAVWTVETRNTVIEIVQQRWRYFEMEVIG